jgi:hypothetical protein
MSRVCVLFSLFIPALVLFRSHASSSANRQITSLMTKTLPDVPGKEGHPEGEVCQRWREEFSTVVTFCKQRTLGVS